MMAAEMIGRDDAAGMSTEAKIEMVRDELAMLERRISFIEATIAAVRADHEAEEAEE